MTSTQDKPKTFMQELDEWAERTVIEAIYLACQMGPEMMVTTNVSIKKAIREKVLESYHNGQKAGPGRRKIYARD